MNITSRFLPELGGDDADAIRHLHYSKVRHTRPNIFTVKHIGVNLSDLKPVAYLAADLSYQAIANAAANAYHWKKCDKCHSGYLNEFICLECEGKGCATCLQHDNFKGVLSCTFCGELFFDAKKAG